MHRIPFLRSFLLVLMLVLLLLGSAGYARAQSGSAGDLIASVNALRAANGLSPYQIDENLNAVAQAHAEYMASSENCTHTRPDGSSPGSYGIRENILCVSNSSPADAIYSPYWADSLHQNTMIGLSEGYVGAGMAMNGSRMYLALDVKASTGSVAVPQYQTGTGSSQTTAVPIQSVQTATPNTDGSIIHEVAYGQTLATIAEAYGLTINELKSLNGIPSTVNIIYPGEKLIIRAADPPTETPTITNTPKPPTRTPSPSPTPRKPTPTRTVTVTPSPTPRSALSFLPAMNIPAERRSLGIGLIVVCSLGLVIVGLTTLRRK